MRIYICIYLLCRYHWLFEYNLQTCRRPRFHIKVALRRHLYHIWSYLIMYTYRVFCPSTTLIISSHFNRFFLMYYMLYLHHIAQKKNRVHDHLCICCAKSNYINFRPSGIWNILDLEKNYRSWKCLSSILLYLFAKSVATSKLKKIQNFQYNSIDFLKQNKVFWASGENGSTINRTIISTISRRIIHYSQLIGIMSVTVIKMFSKIGKNVISHFL